MQEIAIVFDVPRHVPRHLRCGTLEHIKSKNNIVNKAVTSILLIIYNIDI